MRGVTVRLAGALRPTSAKAISEVVMRVNTVDVLPLASLALGPLPIALDFVDSAPVTGCCCSSTGGTCFGDAFGWTD